MKKYVFVSIVGLMSAVSCSNDEPICACIEAGNKVNIAAEKLLKMGSANKKSAAEITKLKIEQKKACAAFERMDGKSMLEKMEDCK